MVRMKTKVENGKLYEMTRFLYRCDICLDCIESISKEPIYCKCRNLSIMGGLEYGGLIACFHDLYTDLSEWKEMKCEKCEIQHIIQKLIK